MAMISRYKEPTNREAITSYDSICSVDKRIILSKLEETLCKKKTLMTFQELAKESLGFMQDKHQKRYFSAMYMVLDDLVNKGAVERVMTASGHAYLITTQGLKDYQERLQRK